MAAQRVLASCSEIPGICQRPWCPLFHFLLFFPSPVTEGEAKDPSFAEDDITANGEKKEKENCEIKIKALSLTKRWG